MLKLFIIIEINDMILITLFFIISFFIEIILYDKKVKCFIKSNMLSLLFSFVLWLYFKKIFKNLNNISMMAEYNVSRFSMQSIILINILIISIRFLIISGFFCLIK